MAERCSSLARVRILEAAFRAVKPLGARAGYGLIHRFPSRLQGAVARLVTAECGDPLYRVRELGVSLVSPVGLAAGLNKDGNLTFLGDALCMGFTVVGSVLPRPHRGARRKLLLRPTPESAVNRLGLPSRGARSVLRALELYRPRTTVPVVNIAGLRPSDYGEAASFFRGRSPWLEVNISCPNTEEHGTFERPDWAARLARAARDSFGGPVLVKIPSTPDRELLEKYAEAVRRGGATGVVAGNTSKVVVRGVQAGLSGAPIYWRTRRMVRVLREALPDRYVIVAAGGVTRPERAVELLSEGAGLVEVLTALLRLGPRRALEISLEARRWVERR